MKSRSPVGNYFHNRDLRLEDLAVPFSGGMLSPVDDDGMITDQRLLPAYQMGKVDSAGCGCGWVACYNALRLLGDPLRPESVCKAFEKALVLRGRLGTRAEALAEFFAARGYRIRFSFTRTDAEEKALRCGANILYVLRRPDRGLRFTAHFMAFGRPQVIDGHRTFVFYNSLSAPARLRSTPGGRTGPYFCAGGSEGDRRTLREVLEPESPLLFIILSIGEGNKPDR